MSQSTTTAPPGGAITPVPPSFTMDADGTPHFWPDGFDQAPDGATPITYTQRVVWSQNLNLAWNAALAAPITPQSMVPTALFWALFTPAELEAINALTVTSDGVRLGLFHALARGVVDLTAAETQAWLSAIVAGQAVTADRLTYVLAGLAPTAEQLAAGAPSTAVPATVATSSAPLQPAAQLATASNTAA